MKTRFSALIVLALVLRGVSTHGQTITLEVIDHFSQTSAATVNELSELPVSFEMHVATGSGNTPNISTWQPSFALVEGSTGTASSTNTGTQNFPATPNQGNNFFFQANFASLAALTEIYPTGGYQVTFAGGPATTFNSGLTFSSSTSFPASAPQATINATLGNGATWSAGHLLLSTSGTTRIDLSSFPEYNNGLLDVAGRLMGAGIADQSGNVIASVNARSGFGGAYNDTAPTYFDINGASLVTGQSYTLVLQYGLVPSSAGSAFLNETTFTGAGIYYSNTTISVTAIPESSTYALFCGIAAGVGMLRRWRHARFTQQR